MCPPTPAWPGRRRSPRLGAQPLPGLALLPRGDEAGNTPQRPFLLPLNKCKIISGPKLLSWKKKMPTVWCAASPAWASDCEWSPSPGPGAPRGRGGMGHAVGPGGCFCAVISLSAQLSGGSPHPRAPGCCRAERGVPPGWVAQPGAITGCLGLGSCFTAGSCCHSLSPLWLGWGDAREARAPSEEWGVALLFPGWCGG